MPDVVGTALVTAVGGDIGWSVARILKRSGRFDRVLGCDLHEDHGTRVVLDGVYSVPRGDDASYLDALENLLQREGVRYLIPIAEPEIERVHRAAGEGWAPATLVMPRGNAIPVGLDKLATAAFLRDHGLLSPWTIPLGQGDPPEFPCILKDRRSWGSRSVVVIDSVDALRYHSSRRTHAVLQQLLQPEDEEYTCGVFRDQSGGIRTIIFRRRLLGGITGSATVVENAAIQHVLRTIADALVLRGSINVQLRLTADGPTVFEINPRFSSTVMFRDLLGFRDVLWAIDDLEGRPIPAFRPPVGAKAYRVFTEVVTVNGTTLTE